MGGITHSQPLCFVAFPKSTKIEHGVFDLCILAIQE